MVILETGKVAGTISDTDVTTDQNILLTRNFSFTVVSLMTKLLHTVEDICFSSKFQIVKKNFGDLTTKSPGPCPQVWRLGS